MIELKQALKKLIITILLITTAESVVLYFFVSLNALWIFFGSFFSIAALFMIYEDIINMIKNEKLKNKYILRNFFFLFAMYFSYNYGLIPFLMTFTGLLNMKISVFLYRE
ncbi:MAG: hypothetical protein H7A31_01750 [Thermotogae bacterium]|nr:hypothetical protein [Thermotogota bacterium]HOO75353.1 hypothetical protein [Tepiditoga sp.]